MDEQSYGKDISNIFIHRFETRYLRDYREISTDTQHASNITIPTRSSRNGKTVPGNKPLITSSSNYAHLTNVILTRCND